MQNGVQHEFSVPPPLIRKELIEQMHADARDIMPPVLLDCVMTMKQPFITPIYDFTAPRIVFGRVAMVGDAAANARPHMGFGVAQGRRRRRGAGATRSRDHDDIDTALKAYNAQRQPIGNTIVMHSRKLGTHMGVDFKTEEDRRMHALCRATARCWTGSPCRISSTPTNEKSARLTRSSWRPARRTLRNWHKRSARRRAR